MSANLIKVTRFPRPDQSQPVYKGSLNLWEAFRYPPIGDATRNVSPRSAARATLDVRLAEWAPIFSWPERVVEATVAKWAPSFLGELSTFRSEDRARLNVRGYDWAPNFGWMPTVVNNVTSTWTGIFAAERASERSRERPLLEVRLPEWQPEPAWIFTVLPPSVTTAQQWPAVLANLGLSYRSAARAVLDVRGPEWSPQDGWRQPAVDRVTSTWAPAFTDQAATDRMPAARATASIDASPASAWMVSTFSGPSVAQQWPAILHGQTSFRPGSQPALDVRGWQVQMFGVPDDADIQQQVPIWLLESGLRDRLYAPLKWDVRLGEWAPSISSWVVSTLPTTTVAQQWPAILQALGLSYRVTERPSLEVRRPEWSPQDGWRQPSVDTVTSTWTPAFQSQRAAEGVRPRPAAAVDVQPGPAWIFQNLPPSVTVAQIWPAILEALAQSYRVSARASLDVRGAEWSPECGWLPRTVDSTVATWASIWTSELQSTRSGDRARLALHANEWSPEGGWLLKVLDAITARWAPILAAQAGCLRSGERAALDVRAHQWAPPSYGVPGGVPFWLRVLRDRLTHTLARQATLAVPALRRAAQVEPSAEHAAVKTPSMRSGDLSVPHVQREQLIV